VQNTAAVELRDVRKAFGDLVAVDDVSLKIDRGTIYGFLGPNGAGKTTAIRMMLNILVPDSGEILLFGEPFTEHVKTRIGYLPEERGLYKKMRVREILYYFAALKGRAKREVKDSIEEWLERLDLADWGDSRVEELSKGMSQKLQFIATILHGPDLLVLDEVFAGLDPVNTEFLKDIILMMKKEGKTVIFSTHVMEQAEKICDSILLINKGRKVLDGPVEEIKASYGTDSIVMSFTGDGGFLDSLPGIKSVSHYTNYVEIKLATGANPQEILREAAGRLEISRFDVVEPTLNSIFIDTVGRKEIA